MKKIGILFGQENTFPQALVERVNAKKVKGITAEFVTVEEVMSGKAEDYAVIIDRISQDVPFYRAYLKNAAISGTAVINNPFWWSADEKFFNNSLAEKIGVPVPKTVLLPSKERPHDTNANSFRNLKFPMNWEKVFDFVGFPAYMKPHDGGGWKSVYKVNNPEELFAAHSETGNLVMMLQEEIKFESYFRCYCIGGKHVHIMQYEPRNPHHLRYVLDGPAVDKKLLATIEDYVLKLNKALGYDFNTAEFAVRDGVPYAIDFCNPAPDAELTSVGEENFEWVVENMANYAIERAKAHKDNQDNLTWGTFLQNACVGKSVEGANDNVSINRDGITTTTTVRYIRPDGKTTVASETTTVTPAKNGTTVKKETVKKETKAKKSGKKITAKKSKKSKDTVKSNIVVNVVEERVMTAEEKAAAQSSLIKKLGKASATNSDDLKVIKGVGPKLEGILNSIGVYTYKQVSKMTHEEYDLVDSLIDTFKGRAKRDDWATQAKNIMKDNE